VYFALEQMDRHSSMHPFNAVHVIEKTLLLDFMEGPLACETEEEMVCTVACTIKVDHNADDDPKLPYNKKMKNYCHTKGRKHWFQEIHLGDIKFLNSKGHNIKTHENEDCGHHTNWHIDLYNCHNEATREDGNDQC
jgi:hypothetical protein